jgi:hypothetical protein
MPGTAEYSVGLWNLVVTGVAYIILGYSNLSTEADLIISVEVNTSNCSYLSSLKHSVILSYSYLSNLKRSLTSAYSYLSNHKRSVTTALPMAL